MGMGIVSFECNYVAKIINYANTIYPQSDIIHRILCTETTCAPACGETSGFHLFKKQDSISINTKETRLLSSYINHSLHRVSLYDIVENLSKLIGITYQLDKIILAKYKPENIQHIYL